MALSIEQFINEVAASGLVPAADLFTWLSAIPGSERPKNGEELARELVKQQKLTRFQAEQLFAGQGKSLALGNYWILDKLGQGGMGLVLKAMHRRMERIVALKVMSQAGMKSPDAVQRFHREVKAAAKLNHPNIVTAYDADESNGTHFLVMEYVEGMDLSALVKERGPLPIELAVSCILQAARGLEYAHSCGVTHRDIKPSNLLVCSSAFRQSEGTLPPEGGTTNIKILDMGLARIEGGDSAQGELTTTGAVMGTVDYMAPEQALSAKSADARSDIYSLGITLWYLLTGRVAYVGDSLMAKLLAHRDAPIPSLAEEFRRVGQPSGDPPSSGTSQTTSKDASSGGSLGLDQPYEGIDQIFRKMVAKQPADRQQSMAEVIHDLECFQPGDSSAALLKTPIRINTTQPDSSAETVIQLRGGHEPFDGSTSTLSAKSPRDSRSQLADTPRKGLLLASFIGIVGLVWLAIHFLSDESTSHSDQTPLAQQTPESPKSQSGTKQVQVVELGPANSPWIDWLEPKRKRGDFIGNRDGWLVEGDSITTDRVIQGIELLPAGTRDAAIRVTYLLRDSRGIQLSARENKTGETLDFSYFAEDNGEKIQIATFGKGHTYKNLVEKVIPSTVSKDAPRTLEFRGEGDTLTLTLNGSVVITAKDATRSEGSFAMAALKGVLIQKVEIKKLDSQSARNNDEKRDLPSESADTIKPPDRRAAEWVIARGGRVQLKNQTATISSVSELPPGDFQLVYVDLNKQRLSGAHADLVPLRELQHLVFAALDASNVSAIGLDGLASIPSLERISVGGTGVPFGDDRAAAITKIKTLRKVFLVNTKLTPQNCAAIAANMPQLNALDLTHNDRLDDTVVEPLSKLSKLESLQLTRTNVTAAGIAALQQALPNCKIISDAQPLKVKAPFDAKQARAHQETWAKQLGTKVETTNSIGAAMILIPPGEFLMGSTNEQVAAALKEVDAANLSAEAFERSRVLEEVPQHSVTISRPFWMGATEVTVGQFRQFVDATNYRTQAEQFGAGNSNTSTPPDQIKPEEAKITWRKPSYETSDEHPVTQVTWSDAVEFCNWLNEREQRDRTYQLSESSEWRLIPEAIGYRLPTEAEWEFACRAGTTSHFSFGDETTSLNAALIADFGWTSESKRLSPQPVAAKKPNPFGLFDMHGNVREWCHDWYASETYSTPIAIDPIGPPSGKDRVMRGGRWSHLAVGARSAFRYDITPHLRNDRGGFRIIRTSLSQ